MKKTGVNKSVIDFLARKKLANLNILGYIENNPACEVFIDSNGAEGGVVIRRENDSFFADFSNDAFFEQFMSHLPSGEKRFCGVEISIAQRIQRIAREKYILHEDNSSRCDTFALLGKHTRGSANGHTCSPLTESDAEEVNEYYTYKSDTSIFRLLDNITKRESACIRIDGELAAWVTVHNDNSMGVLYVKEKHRGKQLGRIVTEDLMEKLVAKGQTPFVHIVQNNVNSHRLITKISGMEFSHVCDWVSVTKL